MSRPTVGFREKWMAGEEGPAPAFGGGASGRVGDRCCGPVFKALRHPLSQLSSHLLWEGGRASANLRFIHYRK